MKQNKIKQQNKQIIHVVKREPGKPGKYHRSRLKLNKDGSITIYE
jgi:hypothetical protein